MFQPEGSTRHQWAKSSRPDFEIPIGPETRTMRSAAQAVNGPLASSSKWVAKIR